MQRHCVEEYVLVSVIHLGVVWWDALFGISVVAEWRRARLGCGILDCCSGEGRVMQTDGLF